MKRNLFIILGCIVMLAGCGSTTESNTQTSVSDTKFDTIYAKNDTVVKLISNTYGSVFTPIVDFDPTSNTYVTVAKSTKKSTEYDNIVDSDKWNELVSSFSSLSESVTKIAQNLDEKINIKVILTSHDDIPILETVNTEQVFNIYKSDKSKQATVYLESYFCTNELGVANVELDNGTHTYTANIIKNGVNKDFTNKTNWKQYADTTAQLQPIIQKMIQVFDKDSNLTIQYIDSNDGDKLLTIENGTITYNCKE